MFPKSPNTWGIELGNAGSEAGFYVTSGNLKGVTNGLEGGQTLVMSHESSVVPSTLTGYYPVT
jgi:hypothetical protein